MKTKHSLAISLGVVEVRTLILLAVLFPSLLFAQDIDISWWEEDKDKDEFSISTSAELRGLDFLINEGYGNFMGKTIKLSGDITLSGNWTPISSFCGIFDGNGYSISGLSVSVNGNSAYNGNAGLFSTWGGQIKNLTIRASKIEGYSAGVLAGSFNGGCNKPIIENVTVTADSVISQGSSGGLVGGPGRGIGGQITISDSYFTGNVTGSQYAGGLVGSATDVITISNSYSIGNVTGSQYAGGLVGSAIEVITISNSYSTGNVTANDYDYGYGDGYVYGGGLVGSVGSINNNNDYKNVQITISNSYSIGNVTANGYDYGYGDGLVGFGGGLVGLVGFVNPQDKIEISDSYSTGDITTNGHGGGLVGFVGLRNTNNDYKNVQITISNSYSTGDIAANGRVGGLVGSADAGGITISDSYSTGNIITADSSGGGLVGFVNSQDKIEISDSYSTGDIVANGYGGGLVGSVGSRNNNNYDRNGQITISNSYSKGDITVYVSQISQDPYDSYYYTWIASGGGLVGSAGRITISDSYSTGNITLSDITLSDYDSCNYCFAGGLVGEAGNLFITNSYASGTAQNGIAGSANGSKTFSSVYYNSEGASSAVNGKIAPGVKALSPEELKMKASFAGWDFVNVWDIEEGFKTPFLRPQSSPLFPQIARNSANALSAAHNSVNLKVQNSARLDIYNIKGKLEKTLHFNSGVYSVSLGDLPKGMYIAKASFGSEKRILRLPIR